MSRRNAVWVTVLKKFGWNTQALIDIYLEESDESILKVATSGGGDIHKPTAKCMQVCQPAALFG